MDRKLRIILGCICLIPLGLVIVAIGIVILVVVSYLALGMYYVVVSPDRLGIEQYYLSWFLWADLFVLIFALITHLGLWLLDISFDESIENKGKQ